MEWARRCLSHRAHRELRDSLFDFSEDSVISPGTGRQGKCVARGAVAVGFIHSLNWETTPYLKYPLYSHQAALQDCQEPTMNLAPSRSV